MIKKLSLLMLFIPSAFTYGQTLRADVLVIGGSPSGVAAAIQPARSKVKTILATENIRLGDGAADVITIDMRYDLPSGIWGEFEKHIRDSDKNKTGRDSSDLALPAFQFAEADMVLKKMTDTIKNLAVYEGVIFAGIAKDGNLWEAQFSKNGKTLKIKAKVVIDATDKGIVAEKAGAKLRGIYDPFTATGRDVTAFRTAIDCGGSWPESGGKILAKSDKYPPPPAWCIPLYAIVAPQTTNVFITESILPGYKGPAYLPLQLELGQGAGAAAAFCAFYNTTTNNLRVRSVQGELLDFKAYLLPFTDVNLRDPDWRAIQQVGATGLLAGKMQDMDNGRAFNFMPDSLVRTAEIGPGLREIYSRAFIWFSREKPGPYFTIGNLLSFISDYTLTGPELLRGTIKKAWKTQFKFTSEFELNRPVTRREFAVLANKYLNPFARTVDLSGRLVN